MSCSEGVASQAHCGTGNGGRPGEDKTHLPCFPPDGLVCDGLLRVLLGFRRLFDGHLLSELGQLLLLLVLGQWLDLGRPNTRSATKHIHPRTTSAAGLATNLFRGLLELVMSTLLGVVVGEIDVLERLPAHGALDALRLASRSRISRSA